jgi:hypothetical protein
MRRQNNTKKAFDDLMRKMGASTTVERSAERKSVRVPKEKVERWALGAVTDDQPQQQALVSLLHAFSKVAGEGGDVEAIINQAMYAAFKESNGLHDEAIAWLISGCEEDRVSKIMSSPRWKRIAAKGGAL